VVDPEVQQAADPDANSPDRAEEAQEQTAPEEAATEIVTEAETPASAAPTRSPRPQARPRAVQQAAARPAPTPEPEPTPSTQDAVDDALSALLAEELGGSSPSTPTGPPLTRGEREGLRLAVQECWVVDVGSEAANVVVTVAMEMGRDGRVVASSMRMVGATGGSGPAVEVAYQAARRAILRCQRDGYGLPAEKYEQWKQIEMTFNPAEMRLR
jgi:outer membrane biosynthesis protein TonB